jgi:enediyne biosynthesis protein E4
VYPQVDQANIGVSFREPSQLFLNQRDGTFRDVSGLAGAALKVPLVGRGLAIGDLFNDGRQEVVVENLEGAPVILRPEPGPRNHWISFELGGVRSNKLALNARVLVMAGGIAQTDEVRSGGSYLSQNDLRLHFGLGDRRQAEKVEISWPSGATEVLTNLEADRFYCVREGAGVVPCAAIRPAAASAPK